MATGIGNLPYAMPAVSPFDTITAQETNERIANIESLADGTGIGDGALTAIKTNFGGNYTTSEVNTGFLYTDGKTIYKRTFSGTITSASNARTTTSLIASGVSTIIDSHGYISDPNNDQINTGHTWISAAGALYLTSYIQKTSTGAATLTSFCTVVRTNTPYSVTIYYTKV